jgi:hypothetical protein
MKALPAGIRLFNHLHDGSPGLALWCPGCRSIHHVPVDGSRGWAWTDTTQTLTPSVKHWYAPPAEAVRHSGPHDVTTCHYFVKGGQIEFLDDCQHSLRGLHALDEGPPEDYGGREAFGWGTP